MKVLWKGYLGGLHSWSQVAQNLSREFIRSNYEIDLFSTNGIKHFPDDLKSNLIAYVEDNKVLSKELENNKTYDVQCSYTAMSNFKNYFSKGDQNRLGIWCYEFSGKNALPTGFAKNHLFVDYILPPSVHAKQVFIDSGIPERKVKIVPHGYGEEFINRTNKLNITKDQFVIGVNIAQPHLRKNISGIIESYFKAFTKKDDVVMLFKVSKSTTNKFDVDFDAVLNSYKAKYKNHPKIIVLSDYIEYISDFYRECDCILSLSHAESFLFPALEALVSKKILICSGYGGQLDFCNKNNSFQVPGKLIRANPNMLYWEQKPNTIVFEPDVSSAVDLLRLAYLNKDKISKDFDQEYNKIISEYTWNNAFKKMETLIK
jgi:glycosyltransferase involved in cell wall biosynthesis